MWRPIISWLKNNKLRRGSPCSKPNFLDHWRQREFEQWKKKSNWSVFGVCVLQSLLIINWNEHNEKFQLFLCLYNYPLVQDKISYNFLSPELECVLPFGLGFFWWTKNNFLFRILIKSIISAPFGDVLPVITLDFDIHHATIFLVKYTTLLYPFPRTLSKDPQEKLLICCSM